MSTINYPNLSLTNYLGNSTKDTSSSASTAAATGQSITRMPSLADYLGADADTVSFSSMAQSLSASGGTSLSTFTPDSDGGAAAKVGCGDFISNFLESSGVDMDNLSADAQKLLDGLADLIANMGAVTQDTKIDGMTKAYVKGQRESYTLQGDGNRLSATIQYTNGVPQSLTVTQLQGSVANTAVFTLGRDDAGKLNSIDVQRVQKEYSGLGGLVGTNEADPLSLALYA